MLEARPRSWRPWLGRVVLAIAAAMALYLSLAIWSGLDRLSGALQGFPPADLGVAVGLVVTGWLLRALRWHYYIRHVGWRIPWLPSTLAFLASFAFTASPGKAGEVVKAGLLRERFGVTLTDTAGILLAERLGDFLAVLLLAAGGLTILADARIYYGACLLIVASVTFLVGNQRVHGTVLSWAGGSGKLKPLVETIGNLLRITRQLLRPSIFGLALILAMAAWACEALAFHLILRGFGLSFPLLTAFSVYGVSTVVGALSMLPGGIGGTEAGMVLLLKALGVSAAEAVGPVVLTRFSTLWLISAFGFVFLGVWWRTQGRGKTEEVAKGTPSGV